MNALALPGKSSAGDGAVFRRGPGVTDEATGLLPMGTKLTILGQAPNGSDSWLQVRTPAGYTGWVSARYVQVGI